MAEVDRPKGDPDAPTLSFETGANVEVDPDADTDEFDAVDPTRAFEEADTDEHPVVRDEPVGVTLSPRGSSLLEAFLIGLVFYVYMTVVPRAGQLVLALFVIGFVAFTVLTRPRRPT